MTATAADSAFTEAAFAAFLDSRHEPDWLLNMRRASWRTFNQYQWPDRRDEEWMRTDIRGFHLAHYPMPGVGSAGVAAPHGQLSKGVELAGTSATVNGVSARSDLKDKWAHRGVVFGSLDQAVREFPELVRRHLLTQAVDPNYDKFAALHASCWSGGCFLYVPRGVSVEEPFHTLVSLTDGGTDFGHTLIVLDEGAEATFLNETASFEDSHGGFHCGAVEIIVGQGARLRYVNLQDWGRGVWHFAHQKAVVGRDASLQWTVGALGARLCKVNQHVALIQPGAHCQMNGTMFTEGRQHLCYHTLQHHQAPHCTSDFLYKVALQDRSRTVWRGMIKVDPQAQQTDGYQRNDNLLLSDRARADSIPGLEIEADDVRCTHGSTSGRVDEDLIFYAMCRGFTRKEAVRMIVSGFFQQIFDRITIDSVRDALGRAIAARVREYE